MEGDTHTTEEKVYRCYYTTKYVGSVSELVLFTTRAVLTELRAVVSLALIVWHRDHSRARSGIAYLIGGNDVDGIRSTIFIIPVSRCYQRYLKRVIA